MKKKGEYGYIKARRTYTIIRTLIYFAISASIFIAGYIATHTKANLLTIVAVLGVLPSSKSAVEMVMFHRAKPVSDRIYEESRKIISGVKDNITCAILYELYLTSYNKNFPLDVVIIMDDNICALSSEHHKTPIDDKAFYEHLEGILKADGIKNINIKLYHKTEDFLDRLQMAVSKSYDISKVQRIEAQIKRVAL